jgi:hypothetical protein
VFLAIMDIGARSISFASRRRRLYGPPDHERAGETFSISSFRLADLGGKANSGFWDQLEPSPLSHRRSPASLFSIPRLPARRSRTGSNVEPHRAFLLLGRGTLTAIG